jgi:hypothetical protein
MKAINTIAVVTALLGSLSFALAQNAPTSKAPMSRNNIDIGNEAATQSDSENPGMATGMPAKIAGHGKYCREVSTNGTIDCIYTSMTACNKANKFSHLRCVVNPKVRTTGSKY